MNNCEINDWLVLIQLNLWKEGMVNGLGYVKEMSAEQITHQLFDKISAQTQYMKPNVVMLSYTNVAADSRVNPCYKICMGIRNVYSGLWSIRYYSLRSEGEGIGFEKKTRVASKSSIYQMFKNAPFELKDRGNYSVRGRQLPKPKGFKS